MFGRLKELNITRERVTIKVRDGSAVSYDIFEDKGIEDGVHSNVMVIMIPGTLTN